MTHPSKSKEGGKEGGRKGLRRRTAKEEGGSWLGATLQQWVKEGGVEEGPAVGSNDGMETDEEGNVWATGKGGVVVLREGGEQIGLISTGGKHTSNVAFGGGYLWVTGLEYLARMPVKVKGLMEG
jgi:sugar lactone lactonase YvrE